MKIRTQHFCLLLCVSYMFLSCSRDDKDVYYSETNLEINWIILAFVAFCIVVLVVYVVRQNRKDKKDLTNVLNNDFKKKEESEFNDEY